MPAPAMLPPRPELRPHISQFEFRFPNQNPNVGTVSIACAQTPNSDMKRRPRSRSCQARISAQWAFDGFRRQGRSPKWDSKFRLQSQSPLTDSDDRGGRQSGTLNSDSKFRVHAPTRLRVEGFGSRPSGSVFRVQGSGFRVVVVVVVVLALEATMTQPAQFH